MQQFTALKPENIFPNLEIFPFASNFSPPPLVSKKVCPPLAFLPYPSFRKGEDTIFVSDRIKNPRGKSLTFRSLKKSQKFLKNPQKPQKISKISWYPKNRKELSISYTFFAVIYPTRKSPCYLKLFFIEIVFDPRWVDSFRKWFLFQFLQSVFVPLKRKEY